MGLLKLSIIAHYDTSTWFVFAPLFSVGLLWAMARSLFFIVLSRDRVLGALLLLY